MHELVAMDTPGSGIMSLSQNWKLTAPVFIGDTITAEAELLPVYLIKPVTQLKIAVTAKMEKSWRKAKRGVTLLGDTYDRAENPKD